MIKLLSWHHKIIWNQDWGLFQRLPFYNLATLMKGYSFIHRVHTYLSPLCSHVILYTAQGQMNKLLLELDFWSTSFIWPLICILVYKHHIFTASFDTCFHTSPWQRDSCGQAEGSAFCAHRQILHHTFQEDLSHQFFFHSLMYVVNVNVF